MEKLDNNEQQNNSNGNWDALGREVAFDKDAAAQARAEAINEKLKERGREVPKNNNYEMELVNFFSSDGVSINKGAWEEVFNRVWENKDDEKSVRYHEKVAAAIDEWNNASMEQRKWFLNTGEPIQDVSNDSISMLTSARVIAFPRKLPRPGGVPPRGPGGEPGGLGPHGPFKPEEIDDTGPGDGNDPRTKHPRLPFWRRMFGGRKSKDGTSQFSELGDSYGGHVSSGGKLPIPGDSINKPPIGGVSVPLAEEPPMENLPKEPQKEPPEEFESEPIEEEKYEIIKIVYEEELAPEELEEVKEAVSEKRNTLAGTLKRGALLSLVALTLLKSPVEKNTFMGTANVDTTTTRIEQVETEKTTYVDDQTVVDEITKESDPEKYRELALERFMSDTHLGDEVELGKGTAYWESPDHEYGGADKHGEINNKGIRREGMYKADRLVVLSEDGEYLGNYYIGRGDSGSLEDLINQATKDYDGKATAHVHFNDPTSGWSEDIILGSNFNPGGPESYEEERVIPGHIETTTELKSQKVEMSAHGETDKLGEDGLVEIMLEDGTVSKINIKHADGTYYRPGEKVVDSNGQIHTIGDIEVSERGETRRINWNTVAWDAAMLGIAGTGLFLATRRRKGEDEAEGTADEKNDTVGGDESITPEVVTRREMMELDAGQFIRLTDAFDELSQDRADEIAARMAEFAQIEDKLNEPVRADSIFADMNEQSRIVARALLEKRDEATLKHLSDLLGVELDDLVERIMQEPENLTEEEV